MMPPWRARWRYALLLLLTLTVGQIAAGIAVLLPVFVLTQQPLPQSSNRLSEALLDFAISPPGITAQVVGVALAMSATVILALSLPRFSERPTQIWLALFPIKRIPAWTIPLMLIPLLAIAGVVITQFGETDVQAQEVLFSTNTGLTIFTAMMVVSVVPFAEEFVFRGALYNALLPEAHDLSAAQLDWKAHRLPFLISMVAFVALHLIAGFGTASAILQIVILSTFLSGLRTITGSVWAPVIAHLCWNALAAVGLLATSI